MRAVVQRVVEARVTVGGEVVGEIGRGFLVLLGVARSDGEEEARALARRLAGLRIFDDDDGRLNLDLGGVGGSVLLVSQFTLLADCRKGRRPSFVDAAPPDVARPLWRLVADEMRAAGIPVELGRFGATMQVALVNDGPVTVVVEEWGARSKE